MAATADEIFLDNIFIYSSHDNLSSIIRPRQSVFRARLIGFPSSFISGLNEVVRNFGADATIIYSVLMRFADNLLACSNFPTVYRSALILR